MQYYNNILERRNRFEENTRLFMIWAVVAISFLVLLSFISLTR